MRTRTSAFALLALILAMGCEQGTSPTASADGEAPSSERSDGDGTDEATGGNGSENGGDGRGSDDPTITVDAAAGTGGSIEPASRDIAPGERAGFTVTPDAGYEIAAVTGCDGSLSGNTYQTAAVSEGCRVEANFRKRTYGIGGSVSGLAGTGLVLTLNGEHDLAVGSDGGFAFATAIPHGEAYSVGIAQQPADLSQTCTADNATGTATGAVDEVEVTCVTDRFSVDVLVTGLGGEGLLLRNNGAVGLAVDGNGTHAFPAEVTDGAAYAVTVAVQPTDPRQHCTLDGATGTVAGAPVTAVLACTDLYAQEVTVSGLSADEVILRNAPGAQLAVTVDGTYTFADRVSAGSGYAVSVVTQPDAPGLRCRLHGAEGTATTAIHTWVACGNFALDFGGGSARIEFSDPPAMPANGAPYTIEAWIRPDEMGLLGIAGWGSFGSDNQALGFRLVETGLQTSWWGSGNVLEAATPDLSGDWHHVASTWDGSTRSLYLDGSVVASEAASPHAVTGTGNFRIGEAFPGQHFAGQIDGLRIWGSALTGATLNAWRHTESLDGHPRRGDLIAAWPFRAGAGDTVTEGTTLAAAYNGTMTGTVGWHRVEPALAVAPGAVRIDTDGTAAELTATATDAFRAPVTDPNLAWSSGHATRVAVIGSGHQVQVQSPDAANNVGFANVTAHSPKLGQTATAWVYARTQGTAGSPRVLFVDHTQHASPVSGLGWEDAFARLDQALAVAVPHDEIWVAAGTYTPTATADRSAAFGLKSGVEVFGGFEGTESLAEFHLRNPGLHETVLSGELAGGATHSYHVVTGVNVDVSAVLTGFTITGGRADGGGDDAYGGGIYLDTAEPNLFDLVIVDNEARYGGGIAGIDSSVDLHDSALSNNSAGTSGGGAYASGGQLTFDGTTVENNTSGGSGGGFRAGESAAVGAENLAATANTAENGGGAYITAADVVDLADSTFDDNVATVRGGGLWVDGTVDLSEVAFVDNIVTAQAGQGGGLYGYNLQGIVRDVTFTGNTAVDGGSGLGHGDGGGMAIVSGASGPQGDPKLERVEFDSNHARRGGGLYVTDTFPEVDHAVFRDNVVTSVDFITPDGGGLFFVGDTNRTLVIRNSLFVGNQGRSGGAIQADNPFGEEETRLRVANSTIAGNSSDSGRGGLDFRGRTLTVTNSILWDNRGANISTSFDADEGPVAALFVHATLLGGDCGGIDGNHDFYDALTCTGVLTADPEFAIDPVGPDGTAGTADDVAGDLHPQTGSPAIDAGDNGVFGGIVDPVDLDGEERIQNGTVDLGAYER